MILTPLQKLTKNGEDWGKLFVAKGFKKLPKVQNIAQSGHTNCDGSKHRNGWFLTDIGQIVACDFFDNILVSVLQKVSLRLNFLWTIASN